jgi:hypothetical protein
MCTCCRISQEATVELDLKQPLGMKLTKSGCVHFVSAGGQFEAAGIRKGDQVVGIGAIRVKSSEEFAATLKLYKAAGGAIALVFTEGQGKRKSAAYSHPGETSGLLGVGSKLDGGTGLAGPSKVVVEANEPVAAAPREGRGMKPRARARDRAVPAPRNRSRSPARSAAAAAAAEGSVAGLGDYVGEAGGAPAGTSIKNL